MRISVIIPCHNRAHTLTRALSSVLAQSSAADEIIVVDDGSQDNSGELVECRYPQVRLIRQQNKGVSAARNKGISAAQYDWIALLDSDDEWLPQKLQSIRDLQAQHREQVLFHSNEIWIRNGKRVNPMDKHTKYGGWIFHHCLPLCVISPSAVVMRRDILESLGGFDESLPVCEDYDLWLRLCHRYPVFYTDQPLIKKFGGHDDQLSRRHWGMDRFRIRSLDALINRYDLSAEQQHQAVSTLIDKLRILLKGALKHNNQEILNEYQPMLEHYESLAGPARHAGDALIC